MSDATSAPPAPTGSPISNLLTPAAVTTAASTAASAVTAVLNAPPSSEPPWAKPAISIAVLLLLAVAYALAYLSKNEHDLTIMNSTVVNLAVLVASYWLGSSSGSTRKTELAATTPGAPT